MFNDFLRKNINGGTYKNYIPAAVQVGYAQVEPNHLSAQRTSQVYAQLPAAANIEVLQQGQFVKYDYARGEVNFGGDTSDGLPAAPGEWMLVYNEIKLYRDFQNDCEFAMIKDNYNARVYSPFGGSREGGVDVVDYNGQGTKQTRYYGGTFAEGAIVGGQATISGKNIVFGEEFKYVTSEDTTVDSGKTYYTLNAETNEYEAVAEPTGNPAGKNYFEKVENPAAKKYALDKVTTPDDMYEVHYNADPFHIAGLYTEKMMKEGTKMVPRVFKTNIGDIFTTNAIDTPIEDLAVGDILQVRKTDRDSGHKTAGFLAKVADGVDDDTIDEKGIEWQIVKIYTMPDHQFGVKIMRIA